MEFTVSPIEKKSIETDCCHALNRALGGQRFFKLNEGKVSFELFSNNRLHAVLFSLINFHFYQMNDNSYVDLVNGRLDIVNKGAFLDFVQGLPNLSANKIKKVYVSFEPAPNGPFPS